MVTFEGRANELMQRFMGDGVRKSLAHGAFDVGHGRLGRLADYGARPLRHVDGELTVSVGKVFLCGCFS